jgi:hypothetical protein
MSVQKRQRERKKAEQAELKRAARRNEERPPGGQVADRDELEGYGVLPIPADSDERPES